jgi:hypothetical protein
MIWFQTDGSVPNTLVIANCEVVKPRVAAAEHISQVSYCFCINHSSVLLEAEVHEFSAVHLVAFILPLMSISSHLSIIRKLDFCCSEYVNHFTPSSSQ